MNKFNIKARGPGLNLGLRVFLCVLIVQNKEYLDE
jgi:hypothetical protein